MQNVPPAGSDDATWPGVTPPQPPPVPPPSAQRASYQRAPSYRPARTRNGSLSVSRIAQAMAQLIGLALGIIEALLLVRIVLLLLAANPDAAFSSLIYGWTAPLVAPFQGVFPNAVGSQGTVLDVAAILAMIVYAILARLVEAVIRLLARW